jgi:site-specific DNA-methyltransferase (adenine-specific)
VTIEPYYQTPDGAVRIYHARWEDVLAAGVFAPKDIALVHADPPYGVSLRTDGASSKRNEHGKLGSVITRGRDFPPVVGDNQPFDPATLLELDRPSVLWGANHYAGRVPGGASWVLWDKREGQTSDNNADGELAWTNLGGPVRVFAHLWRGLCRASESGGRWRVLHPTQKPEALSAWIFAHAEARKKLKRGDVILVPYMGSGPDLRPAMAAGYRVIACDVEELYCRTAVSARLGAMPRPEPSEALGPLFASPLTSA